MPEFKLRASLADFDTSREGEAEKMTQWLESIGSWMVNSYAGQCLAYSTAFLLGAFAVALFDDWYKKTRRMQREASVAALEALFALPDMRDCRRHR
ncbi:MAG TPA: hypothetical protein VME23_07165 [Terracidiphilus sp.]|nr:hypothetical protein [Terracidiphilus sp.]